jgi:hypothetical protein
MHAMAKGKAGRPINENLWEWLKPAVKSDIESLGLSEFCRQAKCESGRSSIFRWREGRPPDSDRDKRPVNERERKSRGLRPAIGIALCRWLRNKDKQQAEALGNDLVRNAYRYVGDVDWRDGRILLEAALILAPDYGRLWAYLEEMARRHVKPLALDEADEEACLWNAADIIMSEPPSAPRQPPGPRSLAPVVVPGNWDAGCLERKGEPSS